MSQVEIMVCVNHRFGDRPSCAGRNSVELADWLIRQTQDEGLPIKITKSVCQNTCAQGPNVRLLPGPELFRHVTLPDLPNILGRAREKVGPLPDLPPPI
jgi:(2Fe-2S) ferredoxin